MDLLKRILEMIDLIQPLRIEHMMHTTAQIDSTKQAIMMCVCRSCRVVATSRESPCTQLLIVNPFLRVYPVQQSIPLPIGTLDVLWICWRISCTWNFKHDYCDTEPPPAFRPDTQLCPVSVQTCHDYDTWRRLLLRSAVRYLQEDRKNILVFTSFVLVWNVDLVYGREALHFSIQLVALQYDFLALVPCLPLLLRSRCWKTCYAVDGRGSEVVFCSFFFVTSNLCLFGLCFQLFCLRKEVVRVCLPIVRLLEILLSKQSAHIE